MLLASRSFPTTALGASLTVAPGGGRRDCSQVLHGGAHTGFNAGFNVRGKEEGGATQDSWAPGVSSGDGGEMWGEEAESQFTPEEGTEVKSDFSEDSEGTIVPGILRVESLVVAGSQEMVLGFSKCLYSSVAL